MNTPANAPETPIMTIWPSISAYPLGRLVGQLAGIEIGLGRFFTLGKLMAVATIPLSLAVFAWQLLPLAARRYTLTDRRVVIRKGIRAVDGEAVAIDGFDAIDLVVLSGQAWFHAGDLVFRYSGKEVFRLRAVSRPEVFRQVCLNAQTALLSIRRVLAEQAVA